MNTASVDQSGLTSGIRPRTRQKGGRLRRYLLRRLAFVVPQLIGISIVTFVLIRLLPGDPARLIAGPLASERGVEQIRDKMGLNDALPLQYWHYISRAVRGDLGESWYTGNSVAHDLASRLPGTLELITYALILSVVIMIPIGVAVAMQKKMIRSRLFRVADKTVFGYGLLAGAIPDFWLALLLVFTFFHVLGWAPAPLGRLAFGEIAPPTITGFLVIDSILARDWHVLGSALKHLALPVMALFLVYGGAILKMTQETVSSVLNSQMIAAGRIFGLPDKILARYALRNALPPIVTICGIVYGFLVGGAVLVETVFGWGGVGQYAVQAVVNSDYAAIQGFVLVASILSLLVYLTVDLLYFVIDPRMRPTQWSAA